MANSNQKEQVLIESSDQSGFVWIKGLGWEEDRFLQFPLTPDFSPGMDPQTLQEENLHNFY